ncbi:hypothetical protein BT96DRAFT_979192 [Gymnopus androsaceus JB14]|uniref:DUF6534 domain-containing protein n=1 Tax=Gymnopus androsaceus JB14 TaxID=1447944 RepID=A0A6A4H683_9AGAR|nr:hypothetical protein BT96DRAFT_979192 [Gymnopus androsaceus JB14]
MTKGPAEIAHGPMFIGFSFNLVLYGIMTNQVYLYFNTFKKDRLWMKILVVLLLLADTVNTVFDAVYLYNSLIVHFDDVSYLGTATWVFATDPAMTCLISGVVQLFFVWRVKVLTSNWWMVAIVSLAALTGLVGGLITTYEVGVTPYFVDFRDFKWSVIMWLVGECLGDIAITCVLVWHLTYSLLLTRMCSHKNKTGFEASDVLVDRIIRLTVQTGLITACCATLDIVFFLTDPTGTHLIFNFPLAKLYTNSVMSSLNSRGAWNYSVPRVQFGDTISPPNIITAGDFNGETLKRCETSPTSPQSRVFVHVESHEMRDVDLERNRPYCVPQIFRPGGEASSSSTTENGSFEENDAHSSQPY